MKANELMIGDWVDFYHPYEPEKKIVTRHRVTEIFECGLVGICNHLNPVHADHIEPIPLAPEILEKNGLEVTRNMSSSRNKDVWSLYVSKYKIFHITEHHNKKMFPYFWIEIGSNSDIKYVHQLQHALRLCGIEKEIEL